MTSVPHDSAPSSDADTAEQPQRVHLKPAAPDPGGTGYVDGAWWPRSRDLAAELPVLVEALATRLGAVERVSYNLEEWQSAARRFTTGTACIRLDGFRHQGTDTVDVIGVRDRVTVLVIPPETSAEQARAVALATSEGSNVESAGTLLAHGRSAENS